MSSTPIFSPQRRVYFLSGFDPRGAPYYYRLFAEQLRRYRRRVRRPLALGRRRADGDPLLSRWGLQERGQAAAELVFLHWDDIARQHWPRQPLQLLWDGLGIYGWYLLGGGLWRIGRCSPRVALCGLYPFLWGFTALLLALASALALGVASQGVGLPGGLAAALALVGAGLVCMQAWRLADQLGVVWLFRSIRFTHRLGQARDRELRVRVQELVQRLLELEAETPAAEVLVVGHSSGSFVLAMLAAELRRQQAWPQLAARVRLLSLGQNLANLAVHPGAQRFHRDLLELAADPRPPWLDVTSRDDYLCFAGVDPYASCGLPSPDGAAYPERRLVPLAQGRGIRSWWQLMGCQFDLHFDYLRSGDPARGAFDGLALVLEGWDG